MCRSVSYTHLDVYKRQLLNMIGGIEKPDSGSIIIEGLNTVSYTHLGADYVIYEQPQPREPEAATSGGQPPILDLPTLENPTDVYKRQFIICAKICLFASSFLAVLS